MPNFIRVTEIWTPTESGKELVLGDGIYGDLAELNLISSKKKFSYGEGLPGKAWQMATPLVLKNFYNTYFLRTEIAHKMGLTSAVAIPIFGGDYLNAVVVFLCGDERQHDGAIELWRDDSLSGMSLVDGYYGKLEKFEWLSKRIKFPRGIGLPGRVWESGLPLLMGDLAHSHDFLRSKGAAEANLTTGIGIPFFSRQENEDIESVITFLSSNEAPVAKRFEVWRPDIDNDRLFFEAGIEQGSTNVEKQNILRFINRGEGTIGTVWKNGIPAISNEAKVELIKNGYNNVVQGFDSLLAIPIINKNTLNSVVVFYN